MRIHTRLTTEQMNDALNDAKSYSNVQDGVYWDSLSYKRSTKAPRAFEAHLGTERKLHGEVRRRPTNSSDMDALAYYAATFAEWGWVIAELYHRDATAIVGPYKSEGDFHNKTKGAFL